MVTRYKTNAGFSAQCDVVAARGVIDQGEFSYRRIVESCGVEEQRTLTKGVVEIGCCVTLSA